MAGVIRQATFVGSRGFAGALLLCATLLSSPGDARAGDFDGRWTGKAWSARCAVNAKIELDVQGDEIVGRWRVAGIADGRGVYGFKARIDPEDGSLRGRAVGAYDLRVYGNLSDAAGGGKWKTDIRNCDGLWKISRVDPPVVTTPQLRTVDPAPPEAAAAEPPVAEPLVAEPPAAVRREPAARDTAPPTIAVPSVLATEEATIELIGAVSDTSRVVAVEIDGRAVALASDGTFRVRRGVPRGESELVVTALDEWGNAAERRVRVDRAASDPARDADVGEPIIAGTAGDGAPPVIEVPPALETEDAVITLEGRVSDASAVVELRINDYPVALSPDGTFRVQRGIPEGRSDFEVAALDEWGNRAVARVEVTRQTLALEFGRYYALVIGNDQYSDMPVLRTAVSDAEAIADTLGSRYGFTVDLLINATRYDIISAMSALRANLAFDDNLLVYYAGHGVVDPITERGYWLPVDAAADNPANWVSNDDITNMLKAFPARHVLVIADSCYSGTLTRQAPARLETWQDRRAWLERLIEKRSRTVFSSGGLEPVVDSGGGGRHSVFAGALLDILRSNTEIIEAQGLFSPVRQRVVLNANQTPQYSDVRLAGHEGGDFVFVPQ